MAPPLYIAIGHPNIEFPVGVLNGYCGKVQQVTCAAIWYLIGLASNVSGPRRWATTPPPSHGRIHLFRIDGGRCSNRNHDPPDTTAGKDLGKARYTRRFYISFSLFFLIFISLMIRFRCVRHNVPTKFRMLLLRENVNLRENGGGPGTLTKNKGTSPWNVFRHGRSPVPADYRR